MYRLSHILLLLALSAMAQSPCPYAALDPLNSLKGKSLLILGTDHFTDVYDAVTARLQAARPEAVSLELYVSPNNSGEVIDPQKTERWKEELLSGNARYAVERHGRDLVLRMGDLTILDTRDRPSERTAALNYALEHGIPFYFTDWGWQFPDTMFGFVGGKIVPISLKGQTTYQNHPRELSMMRGQPWISVDNVAARNRFTADGLRLIYHSYSSLAHIGGMYHFTSRYGDSTRLQTLLPTERQEVHFLVDPD